MYTLAFMFKPGIRVESLGPQEILIILQLQAGSAVPKSYLSDVFLTSSNQPAVQISKCSWTVCLKLNSPLS